MTIGKNYKLVRSKRRKTIALSVTADARLVVRAPESTSLSYIERLIEERVSWIKKAVARAKARPKRIVPEFVEGESFYYMGKKYKLHFAEDADKKIDFKSKFIVRASEKKNTRDLLIGWYKKEAKQFITERVEWYAKKTGFRYKAIQVTSASKRWGSCSNTGNLNFNWKLIMTPLAVIDYVVAHEMAHLEHKNHSTEFWNCVKIIYPNYKKSEEWLKTNESLIDI
jgi:predicted metal-dependent hydrolase